VRKERLETSRAFLKWLGRGERKTFFSYALGAECQRKPKEVEMESNTGSPALFDLGSLYARFGQLHDRRKPQGRRYRLETILTLLVLAKICGEDTPSGMADWAGHRTAWLCQALHLPYPHMPHHSTYRRILAEVVSVDELERLCQEALSGQRYFGKQVLLALDGKVLRGTLDEQGNGVYQLAAYLPQEGLVLMEVALEDKGSEIEAAPRLLQSIDLRDKVVMGDALHTQRALSLSIVERGGEYIWFVKGNQPQLEEDLRLWFGPDPAPIPGMAYPPKDFERVQRVSKGHGRLERRTLTVSSQLKDFLDWPYVEQVFQLERRFVSTRTGERMEQVVYGLTSLAREEIGPSQLLAMTRSYWGIENGLHYRRDVSLHEDRTRLTQRNAGRVLACLNNLVLSLLIGQQKYRYLPAARRYFSAAPGHALELILRV
jgi:predicted transposase YbfD/YdcC